jgi:hypothetical protein
MKSLLTVPSAFCNSAISSRKFSERRRTQTVGRDAENMIPVTHGSNRMRDLLGQELELREGVAPPGNQRAAMPLDLRERSETIVL